MHHDPVNLSRHVQRWRSLPENLSPLIRQHLKGETPPRRLPPVTWERIENGKRLTASLAPGAVTPLKATARILRPHRGEMVRSAAIASITAVAGLAFGLWTGAR